MRKDLKTFSRYLLKWLMAKPHSKYQAFAYAVDRGIIALLTGWLAVTAFVTNQAGTLLLIITILAFMFLGLWLTAHRR